MAFDFNTKVGRVQIDDSLNVPGAVTPSLQNNVYLYGNRMPLVSPAVSLPIPIPAVGYPRFDYYQTYKLNDNLVSDPGALLAYFTNCGYKIEYGYSGTTTVDNIGAYAPVPATTGQVTLYFAGQSLNLSSIANSPLSGTFTISGTSITGNIVSVNTGTYMQPIVANFTGDVTALSATIINLTVNANLLIIGSVISGAGIPAGSTLLTINSATSITLSQNATATATSVALSYTAVTPLNADTQIVLNSTSYTGLQIGENLTLNFVQQSSIPDVNNTEPFIMNLWQSATVVQDLKSMNQNATVGAPGIYFSILPDFASTNYFQPTGDAMALTVAPTVVAVSSPYVTLTIPATAEYASFIPTMTFGATTITQATTNASGVIFQSVLNGNTILVELMNVTGTFNTTNLLTLTLDSSQTIMSLQKSYFTKYQLSCRTVPCIYEINSNTDIATTYGALFTYIVGQNSPLTVNNGQANCSIVFGNQTIPSLLAPTELPNAINNQYYEPVYFPYVKRPGVPQQTVAQTMCAMATVMASNIYPFNPLNDIYLDGFVNSPLPQDWIDMSVGGVGDQIINLGWNLISTNTQGQQYLFLGRAGQTTVNNVPDNEFYHSYVLDTKNYITLAMRLIALNNGVGQVRQTDTTLNAINLAIVSLNNQMSDTPQGDGILANVATNNNLVKVARSVNNPLGVTMYNPVQQVPGFLFAYGTIINYSINYALGE